MRMFIAIFTLLFCVGILPLQSAIVQINGKWCDSKYVPTLPVSEHYNLGYQLLTESKWQEALKNFTIVTLHFSESPFYKDALFYSGVCYYSLNDYDIANQQFSRYLGAGTALPHFEKVFEFKYQIAEKFADGARRHPFGVKQLPKIMTAKQKAIELYDEVISSLPHRDIALKSLYGKGELQYERGQYSESIETLMTLIRRFPKQSLAADSFLLISNVYLDECTREPQNPDYIGLATLNLQRFQKSFPGDERVILVEKNLHEMQEVCAQALIEIAQFYEKKKKPGASQIYYREAAKRYPASESGKSGLKKLVLS